MHLFENQILCIEFFSYLIYRLYSSLVFKHKPHQILLDLCLKYRKKHLWINLIQDIALKTSFSMQKYILRMLIFLL